MFQIKKEIANIWEYKVGSNANIANFVFLKNPIDRVSSTSYLVCVKEVKGNQLINYTAFHT